MSQVLRHDAGTARIGAYLLTELDWLLDMDIAAPRGVVKPLADELHRYDRDLSRDQEIDDTEGIHDYLTVLEVDAVQRLRGWNRLRYGTVTVDAAALSDVRNVLDTLTYHEPACDQYAEYGAEPEEEAAVKAAVERGEMCGRCRFCQVLVMRDRIDALMDAQGFHGGGYYQAYGRRRDYDPEAVWRVVSAPVGGEGRTDG